MVSKVWCKFVPSSGIFVAVALTEIGNLKYPWCSVVVSLAIMFISIFMKSVTWFQRYKTISVLQTQRLTMQTLRDTGQCWYSSCNISVSFAGHYKCTCCEPASWDMEREGKQPLVRRLAPTPCPLHLPFPSYCDVAQAHRHVTAGVACTWFDPEV
jgi:hypothetical protein